MIFQTSAVRNLAALISRQRKIFLAATAVLLMMLISVSVWADTVNFADTTDLVVGTTPVNFDHRASIGVCGVQTFTVPLTAVAISGEGCTAKIDTPYGIFSLSAGPNLYLVTENGVVSDLLAVADTSSLGVVAQLLFMSDLTVNGTEPGLPLPSSVIASLCLPSGDFFCGSMPEVGSISITWLDDILGGVTTDTVSFQSGAEDVVPEPASLALLGSGLLAIAGLIKGRLA